MLDQLPRRALLRFEIPILRMDRSPRIDGNLRDWSERYRCPHLATLDDEEAIADVYCAWNDDGFFAAFDVISGSRGGPKCDADHWWKKDGLRLCIDTRDARDNKRATRFCHFFFLLPTGGGSDGEAPVIGTHAMSRAKEPAPAVDVSRCSVAAHVHDRGYRLEAGIPGTCLHGWAPAEHPRIGLFTKVKDVQRGSQHLTVPDALGWNADPSTWATGVLVRA